MQFRLADDATFSDLLFFQLKLRLDETDDIAVRLQHGENCRQDLCQRNKGDIDHDEVDEFGKVVGCEIANVDPLPRDDAFVVSNFPGQLIFANVVCVDLFNTALEKAVRKSTGGSTGVQRDATSNVDRKFVEGFLQLETAPTDKFRPAFDRDFSILIDFESGLEIPVEPFDTHLPRENEAFCHLPRIAQPAPMHRLIESFFSHKNFGQFVTSLDYLPSFVIEPRISAFSTFPMQLSSPTRFFLGSAVVLGSFVAGTIFLAGYLQAKRPDGINEVRIPDDAGKKIARIDSAFQTAWEKSDITPAPDADPYTLARRLSLALTGAVPSLEELRALDNLPEGVDPVQSWLDHLFADPRYHNYFAERLARNFVGVENGPFLVYRRRRMVNWLAEQLSENRPYDALVRDLVAAEGTWTTNPASNFLTVTVVDGNEGGPDEMKLAARTSRAFLGISLDCMQCHDDKFGDHWKQEHFHELAAFYSQAEVQLTGVRDNRGKDYETRYLGDTEARVVSESVPFASELLPENGNRRNRLAQWITHEENDAFSRAAVNRVWALMTGRPLHDPVDDIPLEGPYPAGLQELADFFVGENHNLQSLIRMIAASAPFQRDSRSADPAFPITQEQENSWGAFPITPLRPEQVAGSIIQASSLQAIDRDSHVIHKLRRWGETRDFVKRYGDPGENEFAEEAGTIPQRLLLMNGKLVSERTKPNPIMNSSTRLAHYAADEDQAIDAAFLSTLTRLPTEAEKEHFVELLDETYNNNRERTMEDIFWALINSTEFSWNR